MGKMKTKEDGRQCEFLSAVKSVQERITEYWLGLENMYQLTRNRKYMLRVDLEDFEGRKGDSLTSHNNQKFTTFDKDQDVHVDNCARMRLGAFWYAKCLSTNPSGVYLWGNDDTIYTIGVVWSSWKDNFSYSMKSISMKIRPVSRNISDSRSNWSDNGNCIFCIVNLCFISDVQKNKSCRSE